MFLTTEEIQDAIDSETAVPNAALTGVSTDTRSLTHGMLFVALRGERFDGHEFLEVAFQKGAFAAVVDELPVHDADKCLKVSDTLMAYGQIASALRSKFAIPIVAVTGSVGKTTMKELIALALSPLGTVLKSEKNENNEIGVPQTLPRLNSQHASAVVEMGMRGYGQIRYLAEIAKPTIGVLTVIGESHIELVGSQLGIADAKGELLETLSGSDIAVLNRDDSFYAHLKSKTDANIISYGLSEDADVRVTRAVKHGTSWVVQISHNSELVEFTIDSLARHDVLNACGALATAVAAGVPLSSATLALENYRPVQMRMEVLHSRTGAVIINDSYNAAPTSVVSALQTLAEYPSSGIRSAFLGDMRELGSHSAELHAKVAAAALENGIREIYAVGRFMPIAFPWAKQSFSTSVEAAEFVTSSFRPNLGDIILVKGSRALELEKVVTALVQL